MTTMINKKATFIKDLHTKMKEHKRTHAATQYTNKNNGHKIYKKKIGIDESINLGARCCVYVS